MMDNPSSISLNVVQGDHDVNEVILHTPNERNSVRAAKRLAKSGGHLDCEGGSKRLHIIHGFCERNETIQQECHHFLQKMCAQVWVQEGQVTYQEEVTSALRGIKDDTSCLEINQHELYMFMENFHDEVVQELSLRYRKHKEQVDALKEQVASLGAEIRTLKIAINYLNAIDKRLSRNVMPNLHEPAATS
ncbi:hypothetical protein L7F22_028304 [Adiantum nelumboides]|nr:hypothetical protein [Adiantum nelumboides]